MSVIIKEPGYKKCFIDSQEVNGLDLFNNKIFNNDKVKYTIFKNTNTIAILLPRITTLQ
jgi:hypothetical protein